MKPRNSKPARPNLACSFAGIALESPFLLASGPATRDGVGIERGFAAGWAGAVTKTIATEPTRHVSPRLVGVWYPSPSETGRGRLRSIGLVNIELISTRTSQEWARDIARLRLKWPAKAIIASVAAQGRRDWQRLARLMESAGACALELNLSCPHGLPERGIGSAIGQNPKLAADCVAWVKAVTKIPVIAKLSPNVTDIVSVADAVRDAGADGISAINTVRVLAPPDVLSLHVRPAIGGFSAYGGYSGPAIHPIALRCVHEILQVCGEICAIGGVSTWREAVSFLLLGAKTVQVCTAVMRNGCGIVQRMKAGLRAYMKKMRFGSVREIVGLLANRVKKLGALVAPRRLTIVVETAKCTRCGQCVTACQTVGRAALTIVRRAVQVDEALCDGCGLCVAVCNRGAVVVRD
jgi:dihydropyrimidine dehydrogenase (NAD+) subunit PreA